MRAPAIEAVALTAGYGETRVLERVGLSLVAGGRLAVLGRNGVGKTTLLASLMGLTTRHAGRIRLEGRDVTALRPWARARAGLGFVPQTRSIFRSLTVEENLRAGLRERPRAAVAEAYALFPRLGERRHQLGRLLSGGEQQMLATARTLLGQPRILLLDEPLEGLAPIIAEELMATLAELTVTRRMTLVLVEQKIEAALALADTALVLERGRVAWEGAAAELRARPALIERYLGLGLAADPPVVGLAENAGAPHTSKP